MPNCQELNQDLEALRAEKDAFDAELAEATKSGQFEKVKSLQNKLENSLGVLERKADPYEYKRRDRLAKKLDLSFVSAFSEEGLAYGTRNPVGGLTIVNDQAVLINRSGNVIEIADNITRMKNGFYETFLLKPTEDGKGHYIDLYILNSKGEKLPIPPIQSIGDFREGVAWVKFRDNPNWSILDEQGQISSVKIPGINNNETSLIPDERSGSYFSDGLSVCQTLKSDKKGGWKFHYVNKKGELVKSFDSPRSGEANRADNNIIAFESYDYRSIFGSSTKDSEIKGGSVDFYSYDQSQNRLHPLNLGKYVESPSGGFKGGLACVRGRFLKSYYFIDTTGKQVSRRYEEVINARNPNNPLVGKRGKNYYILKNVGGKIEEIKIWGSPVGSVPEIPGFVRVARPLALGFLTNRIFYDRDGNEVLQEKPAHLTVTGFSEGIFDAHFYPDQVDEEQIGYYLNNQGQPLFDKNFAHADSFEEGVAKVLDRPGSEPYYIDHKGRRIFS